MVAVRAQWEVNAVEALETRKRRFYFHTALVTLVGIVTAVIGGNLGQEAVIAGGVLLALLATRVVRLVYLAQRTWFPKPTPTERWRPPTPNVPDPPARQEPVDTRRVVPAGRASLPGASFLGPVLEFLNQRGHRPLPERSSGWDPGPDMVQLTRVITPADWAAINREFSMPDNVVYFDGTIRDEVNDVHIVGTDEFFDGVQSVCVELWEEALPSGWAAAAEGQRDEPS